MSLISISKAAKLFDVSRPTLQKALKDGTITGQKAKSGRSESWQIDTAELARVYSLRRPDPDKENTVSMESEQRLSMDNPSDFTDLPEELDKGLESLAAELAKARAELEQTRADQLRIREDLAAAQAVAEERKRLLDDMMKLLPPPVPMEPAKAPARRSWWPWRRVE